MATKVGEVFVDVGARLDALEKGFAKAESKTKQLGKNFDKGSKSIIKNSRLIGIALTTLAVVGFGKLVKGINGAIDAASEFEEANNKMLTVFSSLQKEADAVRKNLVKNFGLSTTAATKMLGATGDLLTGFGFTEKQALEMSDTIQMLSVDLASFQNLTGGAEQASNALTRAMTGERETLKTLGIVVSEELVKAELRAKGQDKLTGMALLQAKAQATLDIALRQSTKAQGDFARTAQSYENIQRRLNARIDDAQVKFGRKLLPAMTKLKQAFLDSTREGGAFDSVLSGLSNKIVRVIQSITLLVRILDFMLAKYKEVKLVTDEKTKAQFELGRRIIGVNEQSKKSLALDKEFTRLNKGVVNQYFNRDRVQKQIIKNLTDEQKAAVKLFEEHQQNRKTVLTSMGDIKKALADLMKPIEMPPVDPMAAGAQKTADKIIEIQKKLILTLEESWQNGLGVMGGLISELGNLFDMHFQNRTDNLDFSTQKELDILRERFDIEKELIEDSLLTETEKADKLKTLDEELARDEKIIAEKLEKDKRKIARKAAKINKSIAVSETLISTAVGAMNAYKALAGIPLIGPALGAAAAAAVTALGLVKVALIKRQPLPPLQEGGLARGPALAGEAGDELVFPLESTQGKNALALLAGALIDAIKDKAVTEPTGNVDAGGGEKKLHITFNLGTDILYDTITRAIDNGEILVNARAIV